MKTGSVLKGYALPTIFLSGAILSGLVGFYLGTEEKLVGERIADRKGPQASAIWFTGANRLAASWREGKSIRIEISDPDGRNPDRRETLAPPVPAQISGDARWLVWLDAGRMHWRDLSLSTQAESTAAVEPGAIGYAVLEDGSAAILHPGDKLELRKPGSPPEEMHPSGITGAKMIDGRGSYVAVASDKEWFVHRITGDRWSISERNNSSSPITSLWVASGGRALVETEDGVAGGLLSSSVPGRIRSRAVGLGGDLLVAGDFAGILRLRAGFPPEAVVAVDQPVTALAASGNHLAYAQAEGISVRRFDLDRVLNAIGVRSLWSAGIFTSLLVMYGAFHLLAYFMNWKFKFRKAKRGLRDLEGFPPELASAILSHQCILYSGDHLSSLAGYPTWAAFAPDLVDWAEANQLLGNLSIAALRQRIASGQPHAAIDAIVAANSSTRGKLGVRYAEVFGAESRMSGVVSSLLDMPFIGLIVSPLDRALDLIALNRSSPPFTLGHTGFDQFAETGEFFALRLRGELERPDRAVLSRAELLSRIKTTTEYTDLLNFILKKRTLLIIGLTFDDIEAELGHIHLEGGSHQHFAYVPVAAITKHEQRLASKLEDRFGIEVYPYLADDGESQLAPIFKALSEHVLSTVDRWSKPAKK